MLPPHLHFSLSLPFHLPGLSRAERGFAYTDQSNGAHVRKDPSLFPFTIPLRVIRRATGRLRCLLVERVAKAGKRAVVAWLGPNKNDIAILRRWLFDFVTELHFGGSTQQGFGNSLQDPSMILLDLINKSSHELHKTQKLMSEMAVMVVEALIASTELFNASARTHQFYNWILGRNQAFESWCWSFVVKANLVQEPNGLGIVMSNFTADDARPFDAAKWHTYSRRQSLISSRMAWIWYRLFGTFIKRSPRLMRRRSLRPTVEEKRRLRFRSHEDCSEHNASRTWMVTAVVTLCRGKI